LEEVVEVVEVAARVRQRSVLRGGPARKLERKMRQEGTSSQAFR
jgi:hypothetical protein